MNTYQVYLAAYTAVRGGAPGLMPVATQLSEEQHIALALGASDACLAREVRSKKYLSESVSALLADK